MMLIEGKYDPLFDRMGLSHNDVSGGTMASCLLPIPIHTVYEVTWNSVNISDVDFDLVLKDYQLV